MQVVIRGGASVTYKSHCLIVARNPFVFASVIIQAETPVLCIRTLGQDDLQRGRPAVDFARLTVVSASSSLPLGTDRPMIAVPLVSTMFCAVAPSTSPCFPSRVCCVVNSP